MTFPAFDHQWDKLMGVGMQSNSRDGLVYDGAVYSLIQSNTLATDEVAEFRGETQNLPRRIWFTWDAIASGAIDIEFFEDTTKTDVPANRLTGINFCRLCDDSDMLVCHTPGGAGDGTQLGGTILLGSNQAKGATEIHPNIWVLKPNTAYLFRATSRANNNRVTFQMNWIEKIPWKQSQSEIDYQELNP